MQVLIEFGQIPTLNVQVFIRKMQVLSFDWTDPALNNIGFHPEDTRQVLSNV